MNICILTHNFPLNENDSKNAGVFVKEFAYKLREKGNSVFVFVPDTKEKKGDFEGIKIEWFSWLGGEKKLGHLSFKNPSDLIKLFNLFIVGPKKLEKFVKENGINQIISMWVVPSGYFAYRVQKKTGIDYSVWALGSDINQYSKIPVLNLVVKKILKNAKFLFANGIVLANEVERIAQRKCMVLSSTRKLPENIKKIDLEKNRTNFLFIGRLEKVKGIDILIETMVKVLKANQNCGLYVLGDGSLRKKMEQLVRINGLSSKITFMGNTTPKVTSSFLQTCDCVIIPSRSESFPLVIGEAAQFKRPMIVSNVGDMEYIIDKYKIGFVFPSKNQEALMDKITGFADGRLKCNIENFNLFQKDFDSDKTIEVFQKIIDNK